MKQTNKALSRKKDKLKEIASDFHCQLLANQFLWRYTTIGIGGVVPFMLIPFEQEHLDGLLFALKSECLPWRILGAGSNLLVDDNGIEEIIISLSGMRSKPHFEGENVRVSAGYRLARFIRDAASKGLGGAEGLGGIPGSIGGAIKMNAGSFGCSISDILSQAELISSSGKRKWIAAKKLDFNYRSSALNRKDVILAADFRLKRRDQLDINAAIEMNLRIRRETQPLWERTAGCIFKNPTGYSAGKLIEELGLKGMSSGGAVVSEKHANFIINKAKARFEDVMILIDIIKGKVHKHLGIDLEEEVEIWSSYNKMDFC